MEQLARDKLLIGPQTHLQIFTPYIQAGMEKTRFITSDAALAAYHALFEDSFREIELRRASELRGHLETLLEACLKPRSERLRAHELGQLVLGPALVILGAPLTAFDADLRDEIRIQVSLIQTAERIALPEWLSPATDDFIGIDYRRCRPISFYEGHPALERYFQAVRWLQLVPLRSERDDELRAWALLASKVEPLPGEFRTFVSSLSIFVGPMADRSLIIADDNVRRLAGSLPWDDDLPGLRSALRTAEIGTTPLPAINDQLRVEDRNSPGPPQFRIMPAFALPDALLISHLLVQKIQPSGLAVAAMLGSTFAEARMTAVPSDIWNAWLKEVRALMLPEAEAPRSLYVDYLDLLRTLHAPPVENAPAFMSSTAWEAKSCLTQLAGWAQLRHTYTLQAKLSMSYAGAGRNNRRPPPGFVEPNPAFWREYGRLIERTRGLLHEHGAFTPSPLASADELRKQAAQLDQSASSGGDDEPDLGLTVIILDDPVLSAIEKRFYITNERLDAYREAAEWFRNHADRIERGEASPLEIPGVSTLAFRWERLASVSRQLERILARQLDEIDLLDSERMFLVNFGAELALTMGYFGSAFNPRDDSPNWAEVAHDPMADRSLGIGIGRARTFHVLYPWQGEDVLCVGAVFPYYEEWKPTRQLTDGEWKDRLDSPEAPPAPDWIQPYFGRNLD